MTGHLDPARYEALVEHLLDLRQRESSLDRLSTTFEALGAVLDFLNGDARLVASEATKPLNRLRFALLDRQQGAKPKLFFDAPDRMGAKGAPSNTSSVVLRAIVNAAFFAFCGARVPQQEASRWLAAELKHAGIKQPNGQAIDARAIVRWDAERGGKSLRGSDEAFATLFQGLQRRLKERYPQKRHVPLTRQAAKLIAAEFIKLLRLYGF